MPMMIWTCISLLWCIIADLPVGGGPWFPNEPPQSTDSEDRPPSLFGPKMQDREPPSNNGGPQVLHISNGI